MFASILTFKKFVMMLLIKCEHCSFIKHVGTTAQRKGMKRQKTQLFYSILINHCMAFCISLSSINRSPIFTGTPFHIFVT